MTRSIASLPHWVVFPAVTLPMFVIVYLPQNMLFAGILPYFVWLYALGAEAGRALPQGMERSPVRFKAALAYSAVYGLIASVYFRSLMPYGIPFHVLAMFCMFYALYAVARSIRSIELERPARAGESLELFFGLWFFPVGIWFVQPKMQRIMSGTYRQPGGGKVPGRPLLISFGMAFAAINAVMSLLIMPYITMTEDYIISNEQRMTTRDFARQELPLLLVYGFLCLSVFLGFLKGRTWSRHLVMSTLGFLLFYGCISMQPGERLSFVLSFSIPVAFSAWYFYVKPNVVKYYGELQNISADG